eukprot:1160111-Pelagomonas_calceolata.AAC.3
MPMKTSSWRRSPMSGLPGKKSASISATLLGSLGHDSLWPTRSSCPTAQGTCVGSIAQLFCAGLTTKWIKRTELPNPDGNLILPKASA